jgi:two-component system, OmpR family, KDP operon response regulator KdpE
MKILMIEDDKTTVEVVRLTMEVQDPKTTIKATEKGQEGLEKAKNELFDVVVLDLGLPDIDGMKVLKELRSFSQIPVLVVSARHDPEVITNALGQGAQDYILKPFKFQSLMSSLRDVTLKPQGSKTNKTTCQITDDIVIGASTTGVYVKGVQVELTMDEWKILNCLVERCGRIVSVKELMHILSECGFNSELAVNMTINQLRKKIGDDPYLPRIIISEYECGYRFIQPKSQLQASENNLQSNVTV